LRLGPCEALKLHTLDPYRKPGETGGDPTASTM